MVVLRLDDEEEVDFLFAVVLLLEAEATVFFVFDFDADAVEDLLFEDEVVFLADSLEDEESAIFVSA